MNPSILKLPGVEPGSLWKYFHMPNAPYPCVMCDCQVKKLPATHMIDIAESEPVRERIYCEWHDVLDHELGRVMVAYAACKKCGTIHWTTNDLPKLIKMCEAADTVEITRQ